ncbi:MAG: aldo/keto reductase [candidate division KSB1 bacterium]|nr:aldo/keto reductase [candidate division KSB1 bacterium]
MLRREFLKTAAAGSASLLLSPGLLGKETLNGLGPIRLGKTGIQTSFLSFGTGTHGSNRESKQTRLGMTAFVDLAQHAFDSGVRFFDAADSYGSHPFLKEAFRHIPREKVTIMTKLWNRPSDWANFTTAQDAVDRFRKELGVDMIDIVLMHCMVEPDWTELYRMVMDDLSKLKAKGVIRACGASFHSIWALKAGVESDWPDVLLARINNTGTLMDYEPETVVKLLKEARRQGKGVIGMKIFGGGKTTAEEQRESSLQFVINSGAVDMMTIGFGSQPEFDDTVRRIQRIRQG